MSDITIDAIKGIVGKTLDQFQEAVLLLKAIHDGTSSQQEIASFLHSVGVLTDAEKADAELSDGVMLVGRALAMLNADTPLPGVLEREWASPARSFLAYALQQTIPLEHFATTVNDGNNDMWLVGQTLQAWGSWASQGFVIGRAGPTHKDRPIVISIVTALLKELRK